jgi:sucrose synthase
MARLDRVKNLAGLAAWYADSPRLQAVCRLFIVGGRPGCAAQDTDTEAASEAAALEALFQTGRLPPGKARWVEQQTNPIRNGELYR